MSEQYQEPPLFRARARKDDPPTSHEEMDRLNANNGAELQKRLQGALEAINKYNGNKARRIGLLDASERLGIPYEILDEAYTLIIQVHKSASLLDDDGVITRDEDGKCFMTDRGLMFIGRQG